METTEKEKEKNASLINHKNYFTFFTHTVPLTENQQKIQQQNKTHTTHTKYFGRCDDVQNNTNFSVFKKENKRRKAAAAAQTTHAQNNRGKRKCAQRVSYIYFTLSKKVSECVLVCLLKH